VPSAFVRARPAPQHEPSTRPVDQLAQPVAHSVGELGVGALADVEVLHPEVDHLAGHERLAAMPRVHRAQEVGL
jgi:hypothetical protein